MTNTSAFDFGACTLWINGSHGRALSAFPVGRTLNLSLHEFYDDEDRRFRAGGFFATELPHNLVLAEIETDFGLHRLIVVEGRAVR